MEPWFIFDFCICNLLSFKLSYEGANYINNAGLPYVNFQQNYNDRNNMLQIVDHSRIRVGRNILTCSE